MQADEVGVFEIFGGDLPVWHHTVTVKAKRIGDFPTNLTDGCRIV